jgi:hypothetical protein
MLGNIIHKGRIYKRKSIITLGSEHIARTNCRKLLDDFAQKQEFYISRDIVDIELLFI